MPDMPDAASLATHPRTEAAFGSNTHECYVSLVIVSTASLISVRQSSLTNNFLALYAQVTKRSSRTTTGS